MFSIDLICIQAKETIVVVNTKLNINQEKVFTLLFGYQGRLLSVLHDV